MKLPALDIGALHASLPIIQGGMGIGISLSGLASAVANAGGIGIISGVQIGFREPDFREDPVKANLRAIASEIKKARELSPHGIIGMNFMSIDEHYDEYVAQAVANGIDLIISGAGLPLSLPRLVERSNTRIAPIVSSIRACRLILTSWWKKHRRLPDAVVVEGPMAGGHLGFKLEDLYAGTYQRLEEIVTEVCAYVKAFAQEHAASIPVIAAGGINCHNDVCRMMQLGASGVQVGSLFVATEECDASPAFKQAYCDATPDDVRIIKSPTGFAARAINTAFCQQAYDRGGIPIAHCFRCMPNICSPARSPYCLSQALMDAANGADCGGLVFCGARVGEIDCISTVQEVMHRLCYAQ
ncbi:MAG: nitronate monooxygenase [Eubacteriales bacterium]|nr:nitronate monooxygenase [Eubacteriales bacterium]